jgi:predicted phage terminase large subunit-like protein
VREQCQAHRATVVLIEDKASGTQLIQELIAEGLTAITRYVPEHDKIMRLYAQTATIENGFVYLPREASWLAEYLHELTTFYNAKYDGQVDSASQALSWIKQAPEPGIVTYYRRQLACLRHAEGTDLRAISAEVDATVERVQRLLELDDSDEESLEEIYLRTCGRR